MKCKQFGIFFSLFVLIVLSSGCSDDGLNSLIVTSPIDPGNECFYGGTRINVGLDSDRDGTLSAAEITSSTLICSLQGQLLDGLAFVADSQIDTLNEVWLTLPGVTEPHIVATPAVSSGDIGEILFSPQKDQIAFTMRDSQDVALALYLIQTSHDAQPIYVYGSSSDVRSLQWSPDGSRLAFVADSRLQVVFANGGGRLIVSPAFTGNGSIFNFEWSPDGSRIAYRARQDTFGPNELYSVRADGSEFTRLSGDLVAGGEVTQFKWAPDSSRIAYRADQETLDVEEIYTTTPDRGNTWIKVSGPMVDGGSANAFAWSPDSNYVSYRANQLSTTSELFMTLPDQANWQRINQDIHPDALSSGVAWNWAPNGHTLVYSGRQEDPNRIDLYVISADGSGRTKVSGAMVAGGSLQNFSWAPDGSRIAYRADQDSDEVFELYSVLPDGSGLVKVSGAMVEGGNVNSGNIFWSPDSNYISYIADQDTNGLFQLYAGRADGSGVLTLSNTAASSPTWLNNGGMAFLSRVDGMIQLFTVGIGGQEPIAVSGPIVQGGNVQIYYH